MEFSIFEYIYPRYKIDKPIRLIELFSGYGSQALALKYLGVKFEHWQICEWAVKSIQAYNDLHIRDYTDYSQGVDVANKLYEYGISMDYNKPMTLEQIKRKGEKWQKKVYNNIIATHNSVDVSKAHLDVVDTQNYEYLVTYSFPCQDLSLAGLRAGIQEGTRSGLLSQVERMLDECKELPQVLLMENVPQVHSDPAFMSWCAKLNKLGYTNYCEDLNAKDYGIPQNRNRCFMVSLLGEWFYEFPEGKELKLKLKDLLEDNVDEKYYLTDKQIQDVQNWNAYQKPLETMEIIEKTNVSPTLTTRSCAYAAGMILVKDSIIKVGNYSPSGHNAASIVDSEGISPTVMENHGTITAILIKNATKQGYLLAEEGDGIDISPRMQYHRGTVQKGMTQTLTTQANVGVLSGLRIRKLTPRECFRLMGVKDSDFDLIAENQSEMSLYHLAGDSIVVDVLMNIFKRLFEV